MYKNVYIIIIINSLKLEITQIPTVERMNKL